MARRTLLIDYHGVISDGERLPAEWRRLLGEFFSPRFGRAPSVWAEANRYALARSLERMRDLGATIDAEEARRIDRVAWLRDMFVMADVAVPDEHEADAVALEAIRFVIPRTRAAVAGADDALRTLGADGYRLYTASGDHSENLDGYLRGLGLRELFVETYGSDLLGVAKSGPDYYRALVAHARIEPVDALVLDDDAWRLDWARDLGMGVILVGSKDPGSAYRRVATIAELPGALREMPAL